MFWNKKICPKCKTGKYTYDLDPKSEHCPYIGCWQKNKCPFYKPLDKEAKKGILGSLRNKQKNIGSNYYKYEDYRLQSQICY